MLDMFREAFKEGCSGHYGVLQVGVKGSFSIRHRDTIVEYFGRQSRCQERAHIMKVFCNAHSLITDSSTKGSKELDR